MAYSANSPAKKCRGKCRQVRPVSEYDGGPEGRICRSCREAFEEARKPPPPVPLGDGRTAITLLGKHARGRVAYVSDARVPVVAPYRWRVMEYVDRNGTKHGPYAVSKAPGGAMLYMHKLITGNPRTDHEDGDGLNNTDENLRDSNQSQNGANRGKRRTGGTSIYKRVRQLPSGSWEARIKVDCKEYGLGCFAAEEDAARAYDAEAVKVWGKFAQLNLPGMLGQPLPPRLTRGRSLAGQRPRTGGTSVYKGVSWDRKQHKWSAMIAWDGKNKRLGRFAVEEDAARAYDAAALAAWGDAARLNFPRIGP